jgi:tetratricopeptide (TPR) repeat protein
MKLLVIFLFAFSIGFSRESSVDKELLKLAKFSLVNGDIENAKLFLGKMEDSLELREIKNRYLATIAFIESDFQTMNKILRGPEFDGPVANTQVCLLKVLSSLALENLKELEDDFKTCKELTFNYTKNRHLWLEYVVNLKLGKKTPYTEDSPDTLRWILQDPELTRVWLKKNVLFNTEKKTIEYLPAFPASTFRKKDIRELIGLTYFRLGDKEKALKFIEDLETPTAENIKGNIDLNEKKYELAYGHFQLALKYKENSKNALERLIPLSWILENWQDGVDFLNKEIGLDTDQSKKLALETAFLIQLNKLKRAHENLKQLNSRYRGNVPKEVIRMDTYVSLMLSQTQELKNNSSLACKKFDGLNCWVFLQMFLWEDLGNIINNDESTTTDPTLTLDYLKSEQPVEPLKENQLIDQILVEELDSALVQIKEK